MQEPAGGSRPERDPVEGYDAIARDILLGTARGLRFGRRLFRLLPSSPRCKLCASPFAGLGGIAMRAFGREPWPKNPKYCANCWHQLSNQLGGADVPCSLVFADVRLSPTLAEGMRPTEFRALMNRFFEAAAAILAAHDAIVDKGVGDEVIGILVPGLAGQDHARKAITGARELLAAAARPELDLPVGAAVHSDVAFVGTVGHGPHAEITAMGDAVNVAAHLASAAGAGECLVSSAAATAARLQLETLEHRQLTLRGRREATSVYVLKPSRP